MKATSRVSSAKICNRVSVARLSRVGSTDPSIEFSIGTRAYSASLDRTAANAAAVLSVGTGTRFDGPAADAPSPGIMPCAVILSNAASVKVPSGPK